MNENVEIGIVVINYNNNGDVVHTEFKPTLILEGDSELLNQLTSIKDAKDQDVIKQNADIVFANWFNEMNEIELSDRNEFHIVSEIVECDKYDDETVKMCKIKYTFKRI